MLPVDVRVEAVQPHAHYRAREIRGEATLPDGTKRPLIHIGDWDFRWQHVYQFVTPFWLPKGTTLSMEYTYDNSASNARNPEHPAKRARWGQRSSDEMGDLWIQVLTRDEPDLVALTRDFRTKVAAEDVIGYEMEIERCPADAALHDDAALLYLELAAPTRPWSTSRSRSRSKARRRRRTTTSGRRSRSPGSSTKPVTSFSRRSDRSRLRQRPQQPRQRPAGAGKVDDAIREFREVVRLQPDSPSAAANLAAALARRKP